MTDEKKCTEPACDRGWIAHQHPLKPLGVTMFETPCPQCNPEGKPQERFLETGSVTIFQCGPPTNHECDDDGPTSPILMECRKCVGTGTVSPHGGVLNCPYCHATGMRNAGESSSCSQCGSSSFDRSWWY